MYLPGEVTSVSEQRRHGWAFKDQGQRLRPSQVRLALAVRGNDQTQLGTGDFVWHMSSSKYIAAMIKVNLFHKNGRFQFGESDKAHLGPERGKASLAHCVLREHGAEEDQEGIGSTAEYC